MNNLEIYEKGRDVPAIAQKKITGGRLNGMTDISPMWRIKKLTELFGPCGIGWREEIKRTWLEPFDEETVVNVEIMLYYKYEGEWSAGLPGIGGSKIRTRETKGIYIDDDAFKKAHTDALSVACKLLGIGADVYWERDTKYTGTGAETMKPITPETLAAFGVPKDKIESRIEFFEKKVGKPVALFDGDDLARCWATLEKWKAEGRL